MANKKTSYFQRGVLVREGAKFGNGVGGLNRAFTVFYYGWRILDNLSKPSQINKSQIIKCTALFCFVGTSNV